jgi:uncharacterized cupin superfamily protein
VIRTASTRYGHEVTVPEAPLERLEHGLAPAGDGWFVLNAGDAQWHECPGLGASTTFEGEEHRLPQLGVGLVVLRPGEPDGMVHAEDAQEDYLVLAGECVLLVEGQERRLKAWDFVHCPAWAEHGFVGAGDGPCVIFLAGARRGAGGLRYPVRDLALSYGAGVQTETTDLREAYARYTEWTPVPPPELPG